jgi:ubiquinone/menaquinone biosynthesis C-methylase UbiE
MKLPHLSSLFSQKIGLDCSFFLTEDDYPSQRLFITGCRQFHELAKMAQAGAYNIETALLIDSDGGSDSADSACSAGFSDSALPLSVIGFVLIERQKTTAECLLFTPVISDAETKKAFQNILNEWESFVPPSCPTHHVFISKADLSLDVTAYYANTLLSFFQESGALLPSYESVYSDKRILKASLTLQKTADLLSQNGVHSSFLNPDASLLEICCGNGMSTLALHEKKLSPLCIDINAEELAIGLFHHVLKPEKTIQMDASALSQNLDQTFETVIGFMIGTIYEFNKTLWFSIVDEAVKVLKKGGILMLTLRTENEGMWISDHLSKNGICGQLIDNRDQKTDYDQWLYFAQK